MRIAHVVTYMSSDGAFGGPTRVALGQAEALAELGHDVTLFAAAPREEARDFQSRGVRVRTFSARRIAPVGGFASVTSPGLLRALNRERTSFDVAHIHLARDLVTLPAAHIMRRANTPYVVQTHGMIDASDRILAHILDRVATRGALESASTAFVLTERESSDLRSVASPKKVLRVENGIRLSDTPPYANRRNEVLFLARLHERKRPLAFIEMAKHLQYQLPDTSFVIVGPDEGEGKAVERAIAQSGMASRLRWVGPMSPIDTASAFRDARAYVLPSVGEVFPMSILESFAAGTPVVTTDSLGIADACRRYGAAVVTDGSPEKLAEAVTRVIEDLDFAERLRRGARTYMEGELDIMSIAGRLVAEYQPTSRGRQ